MKEFFLDEYGKKWPLMCRILGWLVYPLEGTRDSKDPVMAELYIVLELAHQSLYVSWRNHFRASMVAQLWGTLDFATGDILDYGGLVSMSRATDGVAIMLFKNDV